MEWRKEKNNYPDNPIRRYLDYVELDVYHCLRSYAGSDTGRWGYVERSENVQFTISEIASRIDHKEESVKTTLSRLLEIHIIEISENGVIHFINWDEEMKVPENKVKNKLTPAQKEARDRYTAQRYIDNNPEFANDIVERRLIKLAEDGTISINNGDTENG